MHTVIRWEFPRRRLIIHKSIDVHKRACVRRRNAPAGALLAPTALSPRQPHNKHWWHAWDSSSGSGEGHPIIGRSDRAAPAE